MRADASPRATKLSGRGRMTIWVALGLTLIAGVALVGLASARKQAAVKSPSPFAYDSSAPLSVRVVSTVREGAAIVKDIVYVSGERTISAYLVAPAAQEANARRPSVLFAHQLEREVSREEFLSEAKALAERGVVSLLPAGFFPWSIQPAGVGLDRQLVIEQVITLRRGLDLLLGEAQVDPTRVAFVGHDFGAMYGMLMAGADRRAKTFVLLAPTNRFADWFGYSYPGAYQPAYRRGMKDLDPETWAARAAPSYLYFQFGRNDRFVDVAVARRLYSKAKKPKFIKIYRADHNLNATARAARTVFLAKRLRLAP